MANRITHVLIEEVLAQKLGIPFEPYSENETLGAIISLEDAHRVLHVFMQLMECSEPYTRLRGFNSELIPQIVDSGIDGIGTILAYHISNDDFIDAFTSGDVKMQPLYLGITKITANERFTWGATRELMKRLYNQTTTAQIDPQPAPVIEEKKDELLDAFITELRKFTASIFIKKTSKGKSVISFTTETQRIPTHVLQKLADDTDKHVIIYFGASLDLILKKVKIKLDDRFIFIMASPGNLPGFSMLNSSSFKDSLCLGHFIDNSCVIKIDEAKKQSPYADYDSIMKDTNTNVVFALRKAHYVYLMAELKVTTPGYVSFYDRMFTEIVRRWKGAPYNELLKIDKEYSELASKENKDSYIQFMVENSNSYIKKIKESLKDGIEEIGKLQKELMEKMKVYNQYMSILENFDEKAHIEKSKIEAMESFKAVSALPKVKSLYIKNDKIHIYTKEINVIDDRTGKNHNLGTFHIQLNMMSGEYDPNNSIIIKNTKHTISGYSGIMEAPHIFNGGHMCHGNLLNTVMESYASRDLYALVSSVIMFLESVNTSDLAGSSISKWPEAVEEKEEVIEVDETDDELSQFLQKA